MYKPANIREFVTPATLKQTSVIMINGRTQKQVNTVATLRGKVKETKGAAEINANGLLVVNTKTTFITWYSSIIAACDLLTINGVDYQIKGAPENVGDRGRYCVIHLERIEGGA